MANPLRLVMIRHGQSEANIVQHAQKLGQKIDLEEKVETRADWRQRLSPRGREQAERARKELSKIYGSLDFFDSKYTSSFIRARETAVVLSGENLYFWKIDDLLSERNWGIYGRVNMNERVENFPITMRYLYNDPFFMRLDGGDSIFDVYLRFRSFCERLRREESNQNVLIISHKQLIQSACYLIEGLLPERWNNNQKRDIYDVPNLGAIEYSRVNPMNASDVRENFSWRRVLNLGEADGKNGNWEEFDVRGDFSNSELRDQIKENEPFLKETVDKA